jgi:uncharacterized membrane protein (UPF0127 family)
MFDFMKFARLGGVLVCSVALAVGCTRAAPPAPVEAAAAAPRTPTGQPQPRLATIKLWLGAKEVVAEQAVTPDQVHTGMMFRKEMGEDEGMLFIFSDPQHVAFWMRNTLIPLSCAYIDSAGTVLEVHDMKPLDETAIPSASNQVQYVLEMKQGWFERNHIGPGTVVRTERGSLGQTYFRQP